MDKAQNLADTVQDLADAYAEISVLLEAELDGKVRALSLAQESGMGVGATDNYLTIANSEMAKQVARARWRIKELECLRDYYQFCIQHGL